MLPLQAWEPARGTDPKDTGSHDTAWFFYRWTSEGEWQTPCVPAQGLARISLVPAPNHCGRRWLSETGQGGNTGEDNALACTPQLSRGISLGTQAKPQATLWCTAQNAGQDSAQVKKNGQERAHCFSQANAQVSRLFLLIKTKRRR